MEDEVNESGTERETSTPVSVTVNVDSVTLQTEQYETLIGTIEQTRLAVEECNAKIESIWFIMALMVVFELRRVVKGITNKLQKVRK